MTKPVPNLGLSVAFYDGGYGDLRDLLAPPIAIMEIFFRSVSQPEEVLREGKYLASFEASVQASMPSEMLDLGLLGGFWILLDIFILWGVMFRVWSRI
jgi:hypothetical protein